MRINVGCGSSPTLEWKNFDNSPSVWLAKHKVVRSLLEAFGVLNNHQREYMAACISCDIERASSLRLPLQNESVEVYYTSHMLEHLPRTQARLAVREAFRILKKGGIIRISLPNLKYYAEKYLRDGDLEFFLTQQHMHPPDPFRFVARVTYLLLGARNHQWMYDEKTLKELLLEAGFKNPRSMGKGQTSIPNPGKLNLLERWEESVVVEAVA